MGWTDERVEQLKQLWTEGLSASQIARQLGGVTRNAVIGKVHRLGLAGRATPARAERPRIQMPRRTPVLRAAVPMVVQPIVERDPLTDDLGNHVTVLTISDRNCKWPIGDPASGGFHFCGHSPKGGSPYCEAHSVKAFQPSQSRRERERDREREFKRYLANG
jgi:GcrA cell cycle regulator